MGHMDPRTKAVALGATDTADDQPADEAYELTPAGRSLLWLRGVEPTRLEPRTPERPAFEETA